MKLLVCGGREFNDKEAAFRVLDAIHAKRPITLIISGGARGADKIAEEWADARGVAKSIKPAQWDVYGRSAGPRRNIEMLKECPDGVLGFPGNKGTAHMIQISKEAGVTTWQPLG